MGTDSLLSIFHPPLEGLGRLSRSVFAAVETLEGLLSSNDESIRLRAAGMLLSIGFRRMEIIDIEERLSELEVTKP